MKKLLELPFVLTFGGKLIIIPSKFWTSSKLTERMMDDLQKINFLLTLQGQYLEDELKKVVSSVTWLCLHLLLSLKISQLPIFTAVQ